MKLTLVAVASTVIVLSAPASVRVTVSRPVFNYSFKVITFVKPQV
ncbi:hypothetical protein QN382_21300 [Pseudomonas sp. 10B1]|nr:MULTISPECIES: hypothetical protein [unclassified Pseudomonas]MDY7562588.1 hypothetical protein [Pseudomonas sp. AB6]MEA9997321.1 hypothetical protein [Pseudomonas sp. AA4]MEB0086500.1 hypothetical protein [Pseudomonas sp. RTI1]MEB0128517.1 hypothetical protein [Pseudomonas sp. CCC1.2]MEB0155630.1 hypothetical protein [Pseudomonas sp. CCC4.3]